MKDVHYSSSIKEIRCRITASQRDDTLIDNILTRGIFDPFGVARSWNDVRVIDM